jgi:hypothetical protein
VLSGWERLKRDELKADGCKLKAAKPFPQVSAGSAADERGMKEKE